MGTKSLIDESFDPLGKQLERDKERQLGREKQRTAGETSPPARAEGAAAPVLPAQAPPQRTVVPLRDPEHPRPPKARAARPAPRRDVDSSPIGEESPRIKVSPEAFQDLRDVLDTVRRETGSKVTYSTATRAAWALYVRAQGQFIEALKQNPLGKLPSTRDGVACAEYEEKVLLAFATAIRKLPFTTLRAALLPETRDAEEDEAER